MSAGEESDGRREEGGEEDDEETEEQMRRRHKSEVRTLEGQTRAMIKKAPKPKKKEVEAEVRRLENELNARHSKELEKFASRPEDKKDEIGDPNEGKKEVRFAPTSKQQQQNDDEEGGVGGEEDAVARKKEKARRKKEKKAQKEAEREAEIEEAKKNIVRPRDVEISQLQSILGPLGYDIKEVQADGHCLYRAIAHQLENECSDRFSGVTFAEVRHSAAEFMRTHPDDFLPFIDLPEDVTADLLDVFDNYCQKVQATAEWGGQLELRALSHAYQVPIKIYSAEGPVVEMGQEYEEETTSSSSPLLRLTYHRHYYALGEHYNSVVPASTSI